MADIIDLSLVAESRKFLHKLLEDRGVAYFLKSEPSRPFQLEPSRVDLVVRTAARAREATHGKANRVAYEHARTQIRRELIRRVVAEMLGSGL